MPDYQFSEIRDRLDDWRLFNNMIDSPYYGDAVYERFSKDEYERRYQALRAKMRERGLDCVIVPGGRTTGASGPGCSGCPGTGNGMRWPITLSSP